MVEGIDLEGALNETPARRRRPPTQWQAMDGRVRKSLEAAWRNDVPPEATAIQGRWWQFESWLRQLAHLELRAAYGLAWSEKLASSAESRQAKDASRPYMASPDAQSRLAYLDVFHLIQVIENHWELFKAELIERQAWQGRLGELREIRHRIAHCRRPHPDDLGRIEQMLRDLEPGAFRAVAAYNRRYAPASDSEDPVAQAWLARRHPRAQRLLDHADTQYGVTFELTYCKRLWAGSLSETDIVSGTAGYLWRASFFCSEREISNPATLWSDTRISAATRAAIVHFEVDTPSLVEVLFSALDPPELVADGIGECLEAVLMHTRAPRHELGDLSDASIMRAINAWRELAAGLDPRVHVATVWTTLDESTVPVTIFGAGGATRPGDTLLH